MRVYETCSEGCACKGRRGKVTDIFSATHRMGVSCNKTELIFEVSGISVIGHILFQKFRKTYAYENEVSFETADFFSGATFELAAWLLCAPSVIDKPKNNCNFGLLRHDFMVAQTLKHAGISIDTASVGALSAHIDFIIFQSRCL